MLSIAHRHALLLAGVCVCVFWGVHAGLLTALLCYEQQQRQGSSSW